jgi:hypothetical protein
VLTVRDALEVSAEMYKKDANNVLDYIQRHLISLSIWEELRYVLQVIIVIGFFTSYVPSLSVAKSRGYHTNKNIVFAKSSA